jgi:hypothetical protein
MSPKASEPESARNLGRKYSTKAHSTSGGGVRATPTDVTLLQLKLPLCETQFSYCSLAPARNVNQFRARELAPIAEL